MIKAVCFNLFFKQKRRRQTSFLVSYIRNYPNWIASKKNKKGLASVILATNSPNSELVVLILIESLVFVNKNIEKNKKSMNNL